MHSVRRHYFYEINSEVCFEYFADSLTELYRGFSQEISQADGSLPGHGKPSMTPKLFIIAIEQNPICRIQQKSSRSRGQKVLNFGGQGQILIKFQSQGQKSSKSSNFDPKFRFFSVFPVGFAISEAGFQISKNSLGAAMTCSENWSRTSFWNNFFWYEKKKVKTFFLIDAFIKKI